MDNSHVPPNSIEDRQFPGYWEGNLIESEANVSTVGWLLVSISRLLTLVKLPEFKPDSASTLLMGFRDKLLSIALPLRLSMIVD